MSSRELRLSRKLSLGIILLAVPIFIMSLGVLYVQSRYLIHQETVEGGNNLLNAALYRVRNYMSTVETAANSNIWLIEENLRPDSMRSVSNRIVRLNAPVVSSSIFMVPGVLPQFGQYFSIFSVNQRDTVLTYLEPEYDYLHKICYTEPLKTGKAGWIDPFVENTEGEVDHNEAIATYCRPIRLPNGRTVGVLTADMSFSGLSNMLNNFEHQYSSAFFMILGGDGRYLMHPDTTRLFRKTIFTDADPTKNADIVSLGHEMVAGKHGSIHVKYYGTMYHVIYQPVPGTDWSMAVLCPDYDAMKSFYELGYVIIGIIFIGLLLIVWFTSQMVKNTIRPINKLLESTQQIVDGNFDKLIPVTHRKGVMARLQNSFANMQMSLNDRMGRLRTNLEEIRQHNAELEQAQQQVDDTVKRKNLFIQQVAQNMRMPLNVITGFANVMRDGADSKSAMTDEELINIATMMKSNAVNMNRMVLMLFDASETDGNEALLCKRSDEVGVNAMAHECIKHTHSHFPNAVIHFETLVDDTQNILTNHLFLMRTLSELLYNAAKYTNGQNISITVSQSATTVRYTVQDVGPGLPPGSMDQFFKPFTKVENLAEGLGLGLPLAKRHAISLGGDLIFDVDYHEGCRVMLELPK